MKNTNFFPRKTGPKRHSSLFLCKVLCRKTHVPRPPARPWPGPGPPSRPGPPFRPGPPGPLRPSGPASAIEFFPPFFFPGHTGLFPRVRKRGEKWYKSLKSKLLYCRETTLPAAQRSTERCAQASCRAAAFCVYIMLQKSWQLSQISMLTLSSRGSFGISRGKIRRIRGGNPVSSRAILRRRFSRHENCFV